MLYLFQLYEVLLYYSGHCDHNVVTASLETLQQLLKVPPPLLVLMLTSHGRIVASSIFAQDIAAHPSPTGMSCSVLLPEMLIYLTRLHVPIFDLQISLKK